MSLPSEHAFDFDPTHGFDLDEAFAIASDASPPGFDDFWRRRYFRALQVDPAPRNSETASRDDRWRVHDFVFVSTDGLGIGGWLLPPRKGAARRGLVVGRGYGGRDQPDFDIPVQDTAVLLPCFGGLSCSRRPPI
jgi:cephalosporin-C deacetylase